MTKDNQMDPATVTGMLGEKIIVETLYGGEPIGLTIIDGDDVLDATMYAETARWLVKMLNRAIKEVESGKNS